MKIIRFLKYLSHPELTKGVQYIPDEEAEFTDKVADILVDTGHAENVPEPKKPTVEVIITAEHIGKAKLIKPVKKE